MERFGFVGLPNAGKSSLYNALSGGSALAAPYAFATKDPNVGMAKVPDDRLDRLAAMSASRKVVPATVQFVDIGGLVEGASTGEGLGNKFLANIREADAITFVLRAFADDDVPGPSDPLEHLRIVETELALADLATVENQIDKRRKAAKQDRSLADEVAALGRAYEHLAEGTPLYRSDLDAEDRGLLRPYFLLTNKPVLAVVNISEDDLERTDEIVAPVVAELGGRGEVIGMCVQLEAEAAQVDADERAEMLEALGLGQGALPRFLQTAYHLLGPAHVPDHRRAGVAGLDVQGGLAGPAVRRGDPHRLRAGVHQGRGHPLGRAARDRLVEQGPRRGQAAHRGQGLRGGRRRRDGVPLQRLTSRELAAPASTVAAGRDGRSRPAALAGPLGAGQVVALAVVGELMMMGHQAVWCR